MELTTLVNLYPGLLLPANVTYIHTYIHTVGLSASAPTDTIKNYL